MDAAALPSASHLEREFGLFNPEGSGCCPTVDATGAVTCTCSGCERWSKYVAGTLGERWPTYKQYEVLTTEYVAQLARYLRSRRSEIIGDDVVGEPLRSLRVLELGAGDGRLTRHLREELDGHSVEVYATDDLSWTMRSSFANCEMRSVVCTWPRGHQHEEDAAVNLNDGRGDDGTGEGAAPALSMV